MRGLGIPKKDQTAITLGPRAKPTDGMAPMLYASNVKKAREVLGSRGVNVGEIQQVGQGTHFPRSHRIPRDFRTSSGGLHGSGPVVRNPGHRSLVGSPACSLDTFSSTLHRMA